MAIWPSCGRDKRMVDNTAVLLTRKRETFKLERMMAFSAVFAASERGQDGRTRQNGAENRHLRETLATER